MDWLTWICIVGPVLFFIWREIQRDQEMMKRLGIQPVEEKEVMPNEQ